MKEEYLLINKKFQFFDTMDQKIYDLNKWEPQVLDTKSYLSEIKKRNPNIKDFKIINYKKLWQ